LTRIDFYLDAADRLQVACRVAAKAIAQDHKVLIYAPDGETARALDRMMWIAPAIGFVPHVMAEHKLAAETPVVIARDALTTLHDDVLVNLHHDHPASFARFQRLIEIVGEGEADKQVARERYRFYRDRGYEIRTHRLAAQPAGDNG
jgi:DNA polymerase-3 subunit chi